MLSSLLLHASAETLDPAAGPGLFALSLARDFGAHLRAPVFQLDVTSQPARQPASGDPELSDQKASALRSAAEEMGVSISVEIERRMSFGVPNWICDLAKLHDLTVAGVDPTGRRGWDSNPRYGCPYAAFRVRCFRPLSHLSAGPGAGRIEPGVRSDAASSSALQPCLALGRPCLAAKRP